MYSIVKNSGLVVNCGFCYKQQDDLDKILSFSLSFKKGKLRWEEEHKCCTHLGSKEIKGKLYFVGSLA